jgi:aldehyde dehydrogenase
VTIAETGSGPVQATMRIGGRDVTGTEWIDVINPADTREIVGRIPVGSAADAIAATEAAAAAFPVWSAVPPAERAARIRAAGQALLADAEARAVLLARECGCLLSEAKGGVLNATRAMDYYAKVGETFHFEEELPSPNGKVIVVREPMGVTAITIPWNSPIYLGFLAFGPVLMAGNTMVVKPPTDAPLALIDSLRVIEPFFPTGTINWVTGSGATVGQALFTAPLVRKINFTGSSEVGKDVLRMAAPTIKRVSLELGGNDPAVVFDDVDLDYVVPELVQGVFGLNGQICYDVKRIYVQEQRYKQFVDEFTDAVAAFVVGNGLNPATTLGPVINEKQRKWVNGLIDDARARGAKVNVVGSKLDESAWPHGWYLLPAVVSGVEQGAEVVRCEQFGPVIPIMPFKTADEAIALANDSNYGLTSSVWTKDEARAWELARKVQAGSTFINVHKRGASGVDMPYGGYKESGLGRGHGVVALEEQLEMHTLSTRRPA